MISSRISKLLICPVCFQKLVFEDRFIFSEDRKIKYQYLNDKPVLIDFETSILNIEDYSKLKGVSKIERNEYNNVFKNKLKKLVAPIHKKTKVNFGKIHSILHNLENPLVLIIGGGTIGKGSECLYNDKNLEIVSFDVYDTSNVQFLADAHNIPLESDSIDCVIIQYVLEHVIDPIQVVNEIHRVLKYNGIVYAETPFLEQVHEGPFDFTRFTESGHRFLFRDFKHIDSGVIAGVGTHLLWSIDYFMRAIFRSRRIGKFFKLILFWLQYFDNIVPKTYNIDGADSVYFFGTKSSEKFHTKQMLEYYQGNDKKYK